jgi:hypothetical protein
MVRRGCPVLVLYGASVLGSVSVMGQQTATVNWDDIRGRIRAADATFQAVRSNLQVVTDPLTRQSLYPRPRVESFIRANQEQVMSALSPPVLRGARDHVAAYFDAALKMLKKASSATCPDCVTIDSTKEAYDYVSRRNAAVFSLDQIEVDAPATAADRASLGTVDRPATCTACAPSLSDSDCIANHLSLSPERIQSCWGDVNIRAAFLLMFFAYVGLMCSFGSLVGYLLVKYPPKKPG